MSQTCPRCKLISPNEASRCDCGYDFATGKMAASYVRGDLAAKRGGVSNLYRAEARQNLRSGVATLFFAVLLSAMMYLSNSGFGIATIPTVAAVIWLLRAHRLHRQARIAREAERGPSID
jgi:hypothetical protein